MAGKKHTFEIPGQPVPKVRMTQKSKWSPRARRCLDYQEYVAWCAKAAQLPAFDGNVRLTVRICLPTRGRADLDNICKSIQDGLQHGGVIKNDRQVFRYGSGTGFWLGFKEPKVIVGIESMERSN